MPITLTVAEKANYDATYAIINTEAKGRKFQTLIPEETMDIVVDKLEEEGFTKVVGGDSRITIKWGKPA